MIFFSLKLCNVIQTKKKVTGKRHWYHKEAKRVKSDKKEGPAKARKLSIYEFFKN